MKDEYFEIKTTTILLANFFSMHATGWTLVAFGYMQQYHDNQLNVVTVHSTVVKFIIVFMVLFHYLAMNIVFVRKLPKKLGF